MWKIYKYANRASVSREGSIITKYCCEANEKTQQNRGRRKNDLKSWMKFCCCERAARSGCRQSGRFGYFRRPDISVFYLPFRFPLHFLPRNAVIHPRSLSPDRKNRETLEIGCKCFCSARLICRKKYLNFQKKIFEACSQHPSIEFDRKSFMFQFRPQKKSAFLRLHCLSTAFVHSFIIRPSIFEPLNNSACRQVAMNGNIAGWTRLMHILCCC